MAKEIFRKSSLDRLASPEQLDQLLEVTTFKGWVALLGLCGALLAGLAWGVFGSSNTTVKGQGVIIRTGGVFNVVNLAGGRITHINVKVGDLVRAEDVVAKIAQPTLTEKLKNAREDLVVARNARERMQRAREQADAAKRAVMERQRSALEQEIRNTQDQIRLAQDQVPVDEQLVAKGLITKQSAIANRQKIASLEENISKLRAQLSQLQSDEVSMGNQRDQASLEHGNKLDDLNRNIRLAGDDLQQSSNVISPNAGRVVEIKVYPGALVAAGSPIISIEPLSHTLEALAYIPSGSAKEIKPEMEADISPSGVQREEYGYMIGKVVSVGEFPATSEAIVRNFENDSLARSMLAEGPVTEVRIGFVQKAGTPSGFKWSSPQGPPVTISSGSVCGVEVVTREQRPLDLLLPYVRKKFGI